MSHFPLHNLMGDERKNTTRGRGQIYGEAKVLLERGYDANTEDDNDQTALGVLALESFRGGHNLELASLLMQHGAKPLDFDRALARFDSPVLEHVLELLTQSATPTHAEDGSNPLHLLAEDAPEKLGQILGQLSEGDQPTLWDWLRENRSSDGATPLCALWSADSQLRLRQENAMDYAEGFEGAWTALSALIDLNEPWNTQNAAGQSVAELFLEGVAQGGEVPDYLEEAWMAVRTEYDQRLLNKDTVPSARNTPSPRL